MTTTERVEAESHGPHGITARVRGHTVVTDRPQEMGGEDRGLMASEHLLVALASCTATTARKIAEKRKVPLESLHVTADMHFDERGEVTGIDLRIRVRSPAVEAQVVKVLDLAERVCTISKLLAETPRREVLVEPAE